mmetsp:Transcript_16131/g.44058  ORF Transcript_16131/g.44058 Transcript_16131/m.44058 type:complete len:240 (+) Transcript_16131:1355-2074(+)
MRQHSNHSACEHSKGEPRIMLSMAWKPPCAATSFCKSTSPKVTAYKPWEAALVCAPYGLVCSILSSSGSTPEARTFALPWAWTETRRQHRATTRCARGEAGALLQSVTRCCSAGVPSMANLAGSHPYTMSSNTRTTASSTAELMLGFMSRSCSSGRPPAAMSAAWLPRLSSTVVASSSRVDMVTCSASSNTDTWDASGLVACFRVVTRGFSSPCSRASSLLAWFPSSTYCSEQQMRTRS